MALDPRELLKTFNRQKAAEQAAPLSGTRAQKVQRLQVGLFGLISMVLVVALADIVVSRADEIEASVVSAASPLAEPAETAAPRDPLADAGVVPELPVETGAPLADQPIIQETGNAALPAGVTAQ